MAEITVELLEEDTFEVSVAEDETMTKHTVRAGPRLIEELGRGADAADVVHASFRFLLDQEPKESILPRSDLAVISIYFPGYHDLIGEYLER